MHKVDIRTDAKEAAAIERRRNQEKQRQARIFNARERTIGLDLNAIDHQVKERKTMELTERQRDEAFASEMLRNDKIAQLLQQRQEKDLQQLNKELVEYRKEHQRDVDRTEFDLNDPEAKKKDLPARMDDKDPRLTLSGMQLFKGEDLSYEDRVKLQQEQMRTWTLQQMEEKKRLLMEQKKADRLYDLKACEMDQRAMELSAADEETRRALNEAMRDYNLALAKEKQAQLEHDKVQEEDDNFTEVCNHVNGDLLTENPDVAQSAFGAHRVIPDRWKGMSPSQLEDIKRTQEYQRQEKERIMMEECQQEEEWERRRLAEAKAGMVLEAQMRKKCKALSRELAEQNRQLANEQRSKLECLARDVYTNVPTSDYYAQFNTSSR